MTDVELFHRWLKDHPCTEKELWMVQNCIGTVFDFDSPVGKAASDAWMAKRYPPVFND